MTRLLLVTLCATLCAAFVVASPTDARAQPAATERPEPVPPTWQTAQNSDANLQKKRTRVRQRLRAMRAWKLTEQLELDETTAGKLFPILNRYDEQLNPLMLDYRNLRRQLRKMLREGGSGPQVDRQLTRLVDQMTAREQKLWELRQARMREARRVLSPRQAAELFVVLPEIDRQIRRQIRKVLNNRGAADRQQRKRQRRNRGQDSDLDDIGF